MSRILNDLTYGTIELSKCLERLLIISNKLHNEKISQWCNSELTGYGAIESLPKYRQVNNSNIVYSGLNGGFKVENYPLLPGYLSDETLEKVQVLNVLDSIYEIERNVISQKTMSRDLTFLSNEVANITKGDDPVGVGVQCIQIRQVIPPSIYERVYANTKNRIINLLCSYEEVGIDIDSLDISKAIKDFDFNKEKDLIYNTVIVDGNAYTFAKKERKLIWNVIIPISVGIITSVVSGLIVFFLTK